MSKIAQRIALSGLILTSGVGGTQSLEFRRSSHKDWQIPALEDLRFATTESDGLYEHVFFQPAQEPGNAAARPAAGVATPNEDLIAAVGRKDLAGAKAALAAGASSDAVDKNGRSALTIASAKGDLAIVQTLLDAHATVDADLERSHATALNVAAMLGHNEIVKRLLAAGADRNATDKYGTNLLMVAAASGSTELTELVLPLGIDVNAKRKQGGETALDFALGRYHWGVARLLFEKGANLDSTKIGRAEILGALLKREEHVTVDPGPIGTTTLNIDENVADADVDLFKKAIALGAPIDERDKDGNTWLLRAAEAHHVAGVTAMLAMRNGMVNLKNAKGASALLLDAGKTKRESGRNGLLLMTAALGKGLNYPPSAPALDSTQSLGTAHRLEVARQLIAAGAEVNASDNLGRTPLSVASETGDAELVSILLQAGANVEGSGKYRDTPLCIAAQRGFLEVIKVLMAAHANVKAKNTLGETPLDLARKADQDHDTLLRIVQDATKEQRAKSAKDEAAFQLAVKADANRKTVVQTLQELMEAQASKK